MTILLVVDTFNIDTEEAQVVDTNDASVEQIRQKIYRHLRNGDVTRLRVRLKSHALFERFRDFEGLNGVLPTQYLIPRRLLANSLDAELPEWLSDERIIGLDLLQKVKNTDHSSLPFIDKLIACCHADLLNQDFYVFIAALKQQPAQFLELLKIDPIRQRFTEHLRFAFDWPEEAAALFINYLTQAETIAQFLTLLAYEQHQELLRKNVARYGLNLPLPARILPPVLLTLPPVTLLEQNAKALPMKYLQALDELARKIENSALDASVLAHLLISPWESLLAAIRTLTYKNALFNTQELLISLERFDTEFARGLTDSLSKQLALQAYRALSETASVDEALQWSEGYFDATRQSFISGQPATEELNQSFAQWLLQQSARIVRSEHDWRQLSKRIENYLHQDYLVVICMVDALSALHQDLINDAIATIDHLDARKEMLFAPLPTLTEIGKMAVLTGMEAHKLAQDQETVLKERYKDYLPTQNALKVIKSWKSANVHINEQTRLLVYLENRIDERLHDCVDFTKHRKDVKNVLGQLVDYINRWKKDAAHLNHDVVFFITADHGMTVTQAQYQGPLFGEVKERAFKIDAQPAELHSDFNYIQIHNNGAGYLVPKKRLGLSKNAVLTHGGLTPEEVLIPLITLTSRLPPPSKMPLELRLLNDKCQRINDKAWQIRIELAASVTVNDVRIQFEAPFVANERIDTIRGNNTQALSIGFSSSCEQTGLTEIGIRFTYKRDGAQEINNKQFSCVFPEPLIEKNADTQGFEDMFN